MWPYKLVAAMEEPLVIPRALIERFLEKSIPDAVAILSWMRTEKEGDGLSPKLRQALLNLKVSGWANLYLDPRNELKAKLLMLMPPEEIKALAGELNSMSMEQQETWLADLIDDSTTDDEADEVKPLTQQEFDALSDAERMKVVGELQRFFAFCMPMLLNYLALMVHRKSLYQLVAEAIKGDDDSFLKAIQIDKTVLTTIPYFIERNRLAADDGNFPFQRQINTYRNKPIFVSRTQYPLLWLVFAILDDANLLSEFEKDKETLLDLCQRLGAYGPKNDNADVMSFNRRLREFKRDQERLTPRPEQRIIVKPATSSRSRP